MFHTCLFIGLGKRRILKKTFNEMMNRLFDEVKMLMNRFLSFSIVWLVKKLRNRFFTYGEHRNRLFVSLEIGGNRFSGHPE